MGRPTAAVTLERKYARKLGEYAVIEQETEPVVGVDAILRKWAEIEQRKRVLRREIAAIEIAIKQFEPDWDRSAIEPLRTRPRVRRHGMGARAAYGVLREASQPLTTWQIAKAAAQALKLENPTLQDLARLTSVASGVCRRGEGKGLHRHPGKPTRWAMFAPQVASDVSASTPTIVDLAA